MAGQLIASQHSRFLIKVIQTIRYKIHTVVTGDGIEFIFAPRYGFLPWRFSNAGP